MKKFKSPKIIRQKPYFFPHILVFPFDRLFTYYYRLVESRFKEEQTLSRSSSAIKIITVFFSIKLYTVVKRHDIEII